MEFYPTPGVASSSSFAGATLVIAVASHGNVGQLACDLLVQRSARDASGVWIIRRCCRASAATRSVARAGTAARSR